MKFFKTSPDQSVYLASKIVILGFYTYFTPNPAWFYGTSLIRTHLESMKRSILHSMMKNKILMWFVR